LYRYALQKSRYARVSELYVYEKFFRFLAERVDDGDICAVCRISDIQVRV
jgi:GTP-binding protein